MVVCCWLTLGHAFLAATEAWNLNKALDVHQQHSIDKSIENSSTNVPRSFTSSRAHQAVLVKDILKTISPVPDRVSGLRTVTLRSNNGIDELQGREICPEGQDRRGCSRVFVITYASETSIGPGFCYFIASVVQMFGVQPFVLGWRRNWRGTITKVVFLSAFCCF
jgi:hypothetical protein